MNHRYKTQSHEEYLRRYRDNAGKENMDSIIKKETKHQANSYKCPFCHKRIDKLLFAQMHLVEHHDTELQMINKIGFLNSKHKEWR